MRVLAEVFSGTLLASLETAIDPAEMSPGPNDEALHALLKRAAATRWVVSCKPPFAGPAQVLASLARYTHRIALSNDRPVSLHEGQVTFRWTDRAHGNAPRCATLQAEAFLRRFLLHVLPDRFVRIRHYGWLANSARKRLLPTVREELGPSATSAPSPPAVAPDTWEATLLRLTGTDVTRRPCCGTGGFLIVDAVPARARPGDFPLRVRNPSAIPPFLSWPWSRPRRPRPHPTSVPVAFRGPEGLHQPDPALPLHALARACSGHLRVALPPPSRFRDPPRTTNPHSRTPPSFNATFPRIAGSRAVVLHPR